MLSYASALIPKAFVDGLGKLVSRQVAMGVQVCLKKYGSGLGVIRPNIFAQCMHATLIFE